MDNLQVSRVAADINEIQKEQKRFVFKRTMEMQTFLCYLHHLGVEDLCHILVVSARCGL